MFIRPSTISQVSLLILMAFLIYFLSTTIKGESQRDRRPTKQLMLALMYAWLVIFSALIVDMFESPILDQAQYVRNLFSLLFYKHLCAFFYTLPPFYPFGHKEEKLFFTSTRILIGVEILFLIIRLVRFALIGQPIARPVWGELPLLGIMVWVIAILVRKFIAAESFWLPKSRFKKPMV